MRRFSRKFGKQYPVIDSHMHIGVSPNNTLTETDLIQTMDEGHADVQVLFQNNELFSHLTPSWNPYMGNDYIAKIQRMFPDRVLGLATVFTWWQAPKEYSYPMSKRGKPFNLIKENLAVSEIERAIVKQGLWGLKMHPHAHQYHANDARLVYPLMDKLAECQEKTGRKLIIVVHCMGDDIYNSPEAVGGLAKMYPDLLFLAAHAGTVWAYPTVNEILGPLRNVRFDLTSTAYSFTHLRTWEKYGAEKFTAGSDMPYGSYKVKEAFVDDLFPKPEERELVLGGNLAKYLGID
jgi:hypothetical protein